MRRLLPLILAFLVLATGCEITVNSSSDDEDCGKIDKTFNAPYGFTVNAEDSGSLGYSDLAVQADGAIVTAGGVASETDTTSLLVARYTADGRLDTSFGQDGTVRYAYGSWCVGRAVAVRDDGRVVAGGYTATTIGTQLLIVRLNADGTLDTTFGTNGVVVMPVLDVTPARAYGMTLAVQSDGAVVVGGSAEATDIASRGFVLRLTESGVLDAGFGDAGVFILDAGAYSSIYSLALADDGAIVAAGYLNESDDSPSEAMILRLTSGGRLDTTFGDDGLALWPGPGEFSMLSDLAVAGDGSLAAVGILENNDEDTDMLVLKYTQNGALDASFGEDGVFTLDQDAYDQLECVAVLQNGKILAGGVAMDTEALILTLFRLTANGRLDKSFAKEGVFTFQPDPADGTNAASLAVQPGRGILACGTIMPEDPAADEGLLLRVHD